jgi:hypothetical protein
LITTPAPEFYANLNAVGIKVHTRHYRYWPGHKDAETVGKIRRQGFLGPDGKPLQPKVKGGFTVVYLYYKPDDTVFGYGEAYCSKKDVYNAKAGRGLATTRALVDLLGGQEMAGLLPQIANFLTQMVPVPEAK